MNTNAYKHLIDAANRGKKIEVFVKERKWVGNKLVVVGGNWFEMEGGAFECLLEPERYRVKESAKVVQ